jgi:hypothetical protein
MGAESALANREARCRAPGTQERGRLRSELARKIVAGPPDAPRVRCPRVRRPQPRGPLPALRGSLIPGAKALRTRSERPKSLVFLGLHARAWPPSNKLPGQFGKERSPATRQPNEGPPRCSAPHHATDDRPRLSRSPVDRLPTGAPHLALDPDRSGRLAGPLLLARRPLLRGASCVSAPCPARPRQPRPRNGAGPAWDRPPSCSRCAPRDTERFGGHSLTVTRRVRSARWRAVPSRSQAPRARARAPRSSAEPASARAPLRVS